MNGLCIAFNPCCKCDEKGKCNICELTYRRNGQLVHHSDVAPVRHGHWITRNIRGIEIEVKCSVCGSRDFYSADYKNIRYTDFCGDCGAKMDLERRSENEE